MSKCSSRSVTLSCLPHWDPTRPRVAIVGWSRKGIFKRLQMCRQNSILCSKNCLAITLAIFTQMSNRCFIHSFIHSCSSHSFSHVVGIKPSIGMRMYRAVRNSLHLGTLDRILIHESMNLCKNPCICAGIDE